MYALAFPALNIPVRLLDSSGGWSGLASSLGGQLLARGLASGGLAGCLLGTGHGCLLALYVCFTPSCCCVEAFTSVFLLLVVIARLKA